MLATVLEVVELAVLDFEPLLLESNMTLGNACESANYRDKDQLKSPIISFGSNELIWEELLADRNNHEILISFLPRGGYHHAYHDHHIFLRVRPVTSGWRLWRHITDVESLRPQNDPRCASRIGVWIQIVAE